MTDRPMTLEEQKAWLEEHMHTAERLDYIMQSECVRMVLLENKFTPKDLDSAFKRLRKRVRDLEAQHTANMVTIVEQRRQIEMLCEVEK